MPAHVVFNEPAGNLYAEPDTEVPCRIRVRNTGTVVDRFTVEVVGKAASWVEIEPPVVSLFPDEEDEVLLRFRPPRASHVSAGQVPFGVIVGSNEDLSTAVVEGIVEVGPFTDVFAELIPRTCRGRRAGRQQLAVDNRGNVPVDVSVGPADPDGDVLPAAEPATLRIDPGAAAFAKVKVRPRKTFWRGPARTWPFGLLVGTGSGSGRPDGPGLADRPAGPSPARPDPAAPAPAALGAAAPGPATAGVEENPPQVVEGTMLQEALLPRWLVPALVAGVAGLGILAAVWFGFLRPQIESAARTAVAQEAEAAVEAADQARQAASKAAGDADSAAAKADEAAQRAKGAQEASQELDQKSEKVEDIVDNPNIDRILRGDGGARGKPFDDRLTVSVASGDSGTDTLTVDEESVLSISDLVIENSQGDTGTLTLARGEAVLLSVGLQNIRLYDLHYVSPLRIGAGEELEMSVSCTATTGAEGECQAAIDLSGFTNAVPTPATTEP